jgi:hypothetical protein
MTKGIDMVSTSTSIGPRAYPRVNRMWSRQEIERLGTTCSMSIAADILCMSRYAAYKYAKDGVFPAKVFKTGQKYRVVVNDLVNLLYGAEEEER